MLLWKGKTYSPGDALPAGLQALVAPVASAGSEPESLPPEELKASGIDALTLINTSDSPAAIASIPGIGTASADKLLAHRADNGPIETLEAVQAVVNLPSADWEEIALWTTTDS